MSGYWITPDRTRVIRGDAGQGRTFIDPAPSVAAWGFLEGEPWYLVHVGRHSRIVTKTTLADGSAWDTFPNVPAAATRNGREVLHALVRQLVQIDDMPPAAAAVTTGWYELEPDTWAFVTGPAGVAIGADGPVEVRSQLDQVHPRYGLPAPPAADTAEGRAELAAAWRASVGMLDTGPLPVTGGLLACAYLAPMGNRLPDKATFMLWIQAATQSGKSTFIGAVMSHYGTFTASTLPFSYSDSVPATEQGLHVARDLLANVEDYRRTGIASTDASMDKLADFITRAVGNGAGRSLLRRDRTRAPRRDPQAGAYSSTAEVDLPAEWESAEGRIFPVRLAELGAPGGFRLGIDAELQAATDGRYRTAMGGYLRWLAADLPDRTQWAADARQAQRRHYAAQHPELPARTWDQLACMWLGWRLWLNYGLSIGAINRDDADQLADRVMTALIDQAAITAMKAADRDQATRALELLRNVLGTGVAHCLDKHTGGVPTNPEGYGYRRTAQLLGSSDTSKWSGDITYIGGGPAIGRVDAEAGEVILYPAATYNAIVTAAGRTGFPIPAGHLWERWAKAGYTVTEIENRNGREIERSTPRRRIDGRRDRYLVVRLTALNGPDDDEQPDADNQTGPPPPPDPTVPDANEDEPAGPESAPDTAAVIVTGPAGPVWLAEGDSSPCRVCKQPAPSRDPLGPVHAMCALHGGTAARRHGATAAVDDEDQADEHPTPRVIEPPAELDPPGPQPAAIAETGLTIARDRLHLAGVLDNRGLWLPGRDDPIPVDLTAGITAAYDLAIHHHLRGLWFHPNAHAALGLPDRHPGKNPAAPFPHDWATTDRLELDPPGLAAWVNVQPANGDGRRLALVFPAYEPRVRWQDAANGPTLLAGVLTFARTTGEAYYYSPNQTSADMIVHHRFDRKGRDQLQAVEHMPPVAGRIKELGAWSRTLLDEEEGALFVHEWDKNGAELGVQTDLWLGIGDPEHLTGPYPWTKADRTRAAYHLTQVPRLHPNLDLRLPGILRAWEEVVGGGPAWVRTDMLVLLEELNVPFEITESYVWHESARILRQYYEALMDARRTLAARRSEPPDALALSVLKPLYASRNGDYKRATGKIHRPDFWDAIKTRLAANMYRTARTVAKRFGRYPVALYRDALFYVSNEHDPDKAVPAGLSVGDQLKDFSYEGCVPLLDVADALGSRRFHSAFDKAQRKRGGKVRDR